MSRRAKTLGTLIETAFEGPECAEKKGGVIRMVKGSLLKDREEQEHLLAIQPVELNGNAQGSWQPRTQAITAVLGYLQRLWDTSKPALARGN